MTTSMGWQGCTIRVWMRQVMSEKGVSCEAWAKSAKVSPTTLTRFLNDPESDHIPSTKTLIKLSEKAGSQPNLLGAMGVVTASPTQSVPLIDPRDMRGGVWEWGAAVEGSKARHVTHGAPIGADVVAIKNRSDAMRGEGIHYGDTLIVEPYHGDGELAAYTMVVVQTEDGLTHPARYMGEFVVFANPQMVPVASSELLVIGTMKWVGRAY